MHLRGDEVAFFHGRDILANGDNVTTELMARNQRRLDAVLRPVIPVIYVDVCATDTGNPDFDQDFVVSEFRDGNFADLRTGSGRRLNDGEHGGRRHGEQTD
jgi:hypothetical protein